MIPEIHELVNSIVLLILGVLYFTQNATIKTLKTSIEAIDIEKVKQAKDVIIESKDHEVRLKVSAGLREATKELSERFLATNQTFHEGYNELISIAFGTLKDLNWEQRENLLRHYPKNGAMLRQVLIDYDKGLFPPKK